MHTNTKQKHRLHRPFRFSLGIGLGLWLVSANGFNALPSQQVEKPLKLDDLTHISRNEDDAVNPQKLAKQRATYQVNDLDIPAFLRNRENS